jgi:hypothetical protein
MAGQAKFCVYYLASPSDPRLPCWIDYQRCGEHRWRAIYENRDRLPESRLVHWFRELEGEPLEVPVLGKSVALDQKTAESLVRFLVRETNRMATGNPDEQADFLCNEDHPGGRGCGRPVTRIDADGSVTTWPSVAAAAKALGLARKGVWERLIGRSTDAGHAIWV